MFSRRIRSLLLFASVIAGCDESSGTPAGPGITPISPDAGQGPATDGGAAPNTPPVQYLYVPSQSERAVYVFAIGPGAADTPIRKLVGPTTKLENPQSVVVDKAGALYVANYERDVTVYRAGADGDAAPFFTFGAGAHPQSVSHPSSPTIVGWSKTNDRSDVEVFVYSDPYQQAPGRQIGSFPMPNAYSGWQWSPSGPYGCVASSDSLDVCLRVVTSGGPPILCPTPDISGCLKAQDSGSTFQLTGRAVGSRSRSLGFDPDGAVVLSFTGPNTVATYRVVPNTEAPAYATLSPVRSIAGAKTGLDQPTVVLFDRDGNQYVANTSLSSNAGTVTVYPPKADGDVAPIRTLRGFDHPFSLAIGP